MKLELRHINPYIPYGLEFKSNDKICKLGEVIVGMNTVVDWDSNNHFINNIKPILRPLSSMAKEEACELGVLLMGEADMEDKNVGVGEMALMGDAYPTIMYQDQEDDEYSVLIQFGEAGISGMSLMPYEAYEWLFSNHFDVFGLINKGLAIEK